MTAVTTCLFQEIYLNKRLWLQKVIPLYYMRESLMASHLLIEDRRIFFSCQTGAITYEQYLSISSDGLWRSEAEKRIKEIKDQQEEREYYRRNQHTIEGLERYLYKYPQGIFSQTYCCICSLLYKLSFLILYIL